MRNAAVWEEPALSQHPGMMGIEYQDAAADGDECGAVGWIDREAGAKPEDGSGICCWRRW